MGKILKLKSELRSAATAERSNVIQRRCPTLGQEDRLLGHLAVQHLPHAHHLPSEQGQRNSGCPRSDAFQSFGCHHHQRYCHGGEPPHPPIPPFT
jgi:hypothetical protein